MVPLPSLAAERSVGVAAVDGAIQIRERCTLCAATHLREPILEVSNHRAGDLLLKGHPRLDAIGLPLIRRTELDQTFIVTAVPTPDARAERACCSRS